VVDAHPQHHRRRPAEVTPSITTATRSHQQDIDSRIAKYALAMGIRTVCFVLIFVLPWPWKWVAAAGAILLPYVAVLIANAGRERLPVAWGTQREAGEVPSPHREAPEAPPVQLGAVEVVQGEAVETPSDSPPQRPPGRASDTPWDGRGARPHGRGRDGDDGETRVDRAS